MEKDRDSEQERQRLTEGERMKKKEGRRVDDIREREKQRDIVNEAKRKRWLKRRMDGERER